MIRCNAIEIGLFFLLVASATCEVVAASAPGPISEDTAKIRGLMNVVEWALQDKAVHERLEERTYQIAVKCELPSETTAAIVGQLRQVLKDFSVEKATAWSRLQDRSQIHVETQLIKHTSGPVLKSRAYQQVLQQRLTADQLASWNEVAVAFIAEDRLLFARRQRIRKSLQAKVRARADVDQTRRDLARSLIWIGQDFSGTKKSADSTAKRMVEVSGTATRLHYDNLIEVVDVECDLTAVQKRKLSLAAKGIAIRTHRTLDARRRNIAVVDEAASYQRQMREFTAHDAFKATQLDPAFWKTTLQRTLTQSQLASWTAGAAKGTKK